MNQALYIVLDMFSLIFTTLNSRCYYPHVADDNFESMVLFKGKRSKIIKNSGKIGKHYKFW